MKMKNRSSKLNRIDEILQYLMQTELIYWKNIQIAIMGLSCPEIFIKSMVIL